jgi:hypothetical protein
MHHLVVYNASYYQQTYFFALQLSPRVKTKPVHLSGEAERITPTYTLITETGGTKNTHYTVKT